jgi:uncharacterized protein
MNPVGFGTRDRRLFGVYSPAAGRRTRRAVVICPPLGQEYLRAHRSSRLLAQQLADTGHDVLRFDYYGTGDSGGDTSEITLDGMAQDAVEAVAEVADLAGARRVTLIGMRLGCLVAARVLAAGGRLRPDRVVLWDPVRSGADWLREVVPPVPPWRRSARRRADPVSGVSAALAAELSEAGEGEYDIIAGIGSLLVVSDAESHRPLRQRLLDRGWTGRYECEEGPPCWVEEGDLGVGVVPVGILQRITDWT